MTTAAEIQQLGDMAVAAGTATREQVDQWVAADIAALGQPDAAVPGAQPSAQPPTTPMSPQEQDLRASAEALIQQGVITKEDAERLIQQQLGQPQQQQAAQSPAQEAPPRPEVLQDVNPLEPGFDRPPTPDAYQFPPFDLPQVAERDMLGAQQEVRQIMFDARMPQSVAEPVWREFEKLLRQPMNHAEHELTKASTHVTLGRIWGDRKDEMLDYGNRLMDVLCAAHPALREAFSSTGAGSHPVIVAQICEHAARLYRKS